MIAVVWSSDVTVHLCQLHILDPSRCVHVYWVTMVTLRLTANICPCKWITLLTEAIQALQSPYLPPPPPTSGGLPSLRPTERQLVWADVPVWVRARSTRGRRQGRGDPTWSLQTLLAFREFRYRLILQQRFRNTEKTLNKTSVCWSSDVHAPEHHSQQVVIFNLLTFSFFKDVKISLLLQLFWNVVHLINM